MAYDVPAHEGMGASLGVDIETILGPFSFQASATHEGVGVGVLTLDESVVVPAGELYSIGYRGGIVTDPSCEEGMIGTASSNVTITITPIPEPAAVLLLASGGLAVMARRRRG